MDASRGHANRAPNWRDKGMREGTPDPRVASHAVLLLVAESRSGGSGESSYSGSCMMVAAVPSRQDLTDEPFVSTVEGVWAMHAALQHAGYVLVQGSVEQSEAAFKLSGLIE